MTKIINQISPKELSDGNLFLNRNLNLSNRGMIITLISALNIKQDATIADLPELTGLSEWDVRTGMAALVRTGYLKRRHISISGRLEWEHVLVNGANSKE